QRGRYETEGAVDGAGRRSGPYCSGRAAPVESCRRRPWDAGNFTGQLAGGPGVVYNSAAWGGSSAGGASRSQCEGREFDPPPLHHFTARYEPTPPIPTGSRKELLKNGETGTTPVLPSRHPCDFAISTVVLGIVEVAFKILEGIGARTAIEIRLKRHGRKLLATLDLQHGLVPAYDRNDERGTVDFPFHLALERRG